MLSLRSPKNFGDENLEVNYWLVSGRFGALKQNLMLRARQGLDYSNFQHFFIVFMGRISRENTKEEIRRMKRGRKKRKRLQRNLIKEKTLASELKIEKIL